MALVAHSTPVKNSINGIDNLQTIPLQPPVMNSVQLSPRLRRARLIKMKLQLAYYKVRTNQTHIPTSSLKLNGNDKVEDSLLLKTAKFEPVEKEKAKIKENEDEDDGIDNNETIDQSCDKIDNDSIIDKTSLEKVQVSKHSINVNNIQQRSHSRLDDVVIGKSKSNRKSNSNTNKITKPSINSQNFRLSLTSPSRFAHTSKLSTKSKPSNIFIPRPRNIFNTSLTMSNGSINNNSANANSTVDEEDLTVEDPDQTIFQTSLTQSIPPPPLSAPLIPTETPLRRNKQRSHSFSNDTILSSPSRLLSTPSSIGAARCLLQLAHR